MRLYSELVDWYRLLDPLADHEEEAQIYDRALREAGVPDGGTLLELGAGAGHNFYLKRRYRCVLTDLSPAMLALSRELNPECEHVVGDMRTLRLDRAFDAVFVHDAVMYMTTEEMLAQAIATAYAHTRRGGVALFAPDCVRETFSDGAVLLEADEGARSLRGVEWSWDPDPADCISATDYTLLLREGATMRSVHDRVVEGLFPRATWARLLAEAGFVVSTVERHLDGDGVHDELFIGRRP
jgi:SAM-dependent methyltransferase